MAKLCANEPVLGKLVCAICHVLAAENAHRQHLFWGHFRCELRMKTPPSRFSKVMNIVFLHQVIDYYLLFLHGISADQ